jgi:hypothetical protein
MVRVRMWLLAVCATALACAGGEEAASEEGMAEMAETFGAELSGANEVPAVTTDASGTATFTLQNDSILAFSITVNDIDAARGAHIHAGGTGQNGGVLVPLFGGPATAEDFSGTLAEGTVAVADSVLAAMRAGQAYVNVHTAAHPPGEIRGQIQPH